MAYVKQCGSASGTTAAQVVSITSAPVATSPPNRLVAHIKCGSTHTVSSITDTKGNTWHVDIQDTHGTSGRTAIASTPQDVGILTTTDTVTVTPDASNSMVSVIQEWSGLNTSTVQATYLDGTGSGGGGAALTGAASVTTGTNGSVAISGLSVNVAQATVPTVASPFTREAGASFGANALAIADDTVTTAGLVTSTWSWPTSASWSVAIAAYKVAGTTPVSIAPTATSVSGGVAAVNAAELLTPTAQSPSTATAKVTAPVLLTPSAQSPSIATAAVLAQVLLSLVAQSPSAASAIVSIPGVFLTPTAQSPSSATAAVLAQVFLTPAAQSPSAASAAVLARVLLSLAAASSSSAVAVVTTPFVAAVVPQRTVRGYGL